MRTPTQSMMRMAGMALWMLSVMPRSMSFQDQPRRNAQAPGQEGRGHEEDLGLDLVDAVADAEEKSHEDEGEEGDRRRTGAAARARLRSRCFHGLRRGGSCAERPAGQELPVPHHRPPAGDDRVEPEAPCRG